MTLPRHQRSIPPNLTALTSAAAGGGVALPQPPHLPIGRLRRLTAWLRHGTTPSAGHQPIPDSPAALDGLPPAPPEPAGTRLTLTQMALSREILDAILHDTHPTRLPNARQTNALTATIHAALRTGWRGRDLTTALARWDTDKMRLAYPLLRDKLAVLAPRAGYHCPDCGTPTPTDRHSHTLPGYCRTCHRYTARG